MYSRASVYSKEEDLMRSRSFQDIDFHLKSSSIENDFQDEK